jgi:tripartite-type tricarboxylate transporter receptor subunit TctC
MNPTFKLVGLFFALALACGQSAAQEFPNRPLKFVVGFAPGGGNDSLARLVAPKLSEQLGQPVIVENRVGADGRISSEFVAKAPPDGYTLLIGATGPMVYGPGLYANLPYDAVKDFVPITMFGFSQLVFAVHPSVAAHSINDLIALAKAKPGEMFYASPSTPHHVGFELFKMTAGIDIRHVPYKGGAPAVIAAMSGEVPIVISSVSDMFTQLKAGKLRPLAVTGETRSPFLPEVPTVIESGINFTGVAWTGLFAPAGTPRPIIDKLYGALAVVLRSESMKERFLAIGYETAWMGMPPAEFGALHRADVAKWGKVIKDLKLSVE